MRMRRKCSERDSGVALGNIEFWRFGTSNRRCMQRLTVSKLPPLSTLDTVLIPSVLVGEDAYGLLSSSIHNDEGNRRVLVGP